MNRPYRLLLDPDPATSGGGTATPSPTPTPTPSATIQVTADEFRRLQQSQTRLAEIEAANARVLETNEQERLLALAAKGKADEALTALRTAKDAEIKQANDRAAGLESSILGDRKAATLVASLLGAKFLSPVAADQVQQLLAGRFEATRDAAGVIQVREKGTGKPAAEVVTAWLASADAAHFLSPTSAGGAGSTGTEKPAPATAADDAAIDKLPFDQKLVLAMSARPKDANFNPYQLGRPAAKSSAG